MKRSGRIVIFLISILAIVSACSSRELVPEDELRWQPLARIPIGARNGHSTVWTGEQIILWGGGSELGTGSAEGALFDPVTHTWSLIPDAPISGRWFHSAIWTGEEMIVWGGRRPGLHADGATYDPKSNTWRTIASAPLRGRSGHSASWTGEEMIIFGGHISPDNNDYIGDAAAYDPFADTWRILPESGLSERMDASAIWTGTELVVWGGVNGNGWLNDGAVYSPTDDSWHPMADAPLDPRQNAGVRLDGRSLVFFGGIHNADSFEVPAAVYHLNGNRWEEVVDPVAASVARPAPGDVIGLLPEGTTVMIDDRPLAVPALPSGPGWGSALYTGDALVVLGGEAAQDTPGNQAFILQLRR